MIGCEGVRELAQAYLEGELSPADRERLERHLQACPACHQVVVTYGQLFAALAEPAIPQSASGAAARVLARIGAAQRRRRALQAAALAAGLLLAAGAAAVIAWGALPDVVPSTTEAAPSLDAWRGVWESSVRVAEDVASGGGEWLRAVPGGAGVLVLLVAAIVAQALLAYRWRMLASPHSTK